MFNREQDLVQAFTSESNNFLKALFKKNVSRYFLVQEFDSNFGIADVVLGTFNATISNRIKRPSVNPNWIQPVSKFKCGMVFTTEEFCNSFGLSRAHAVKQLAEYELAGFIAQMTQGKFIVVEEYQEVAESIVSIEAKLKNWKRALLQALRYKRFSDFSFVLLDYASIPSALKHLDDFKSNNIGLVSMEDRQLKFHFVPERNDRRQPEHYLRINEVAVDHFISTKKAY